MGSMFQWGRRVYREKVISFFCLRRKFIEHSVNEDIIIAQQTQKAGTKYQMHAVFEALVMPGHTRLIPHPRQ